MATNKDLINLTQPYWGMQEGSLSPITEDPQPVMKDKVYNDDRVGLGLNLTSGYMLSSNVAEATGQSEKIMPSTLKNENILSQLSGTTTRNIMSYSDSNIEALKAQNDKLLKAMAQGNMKNYPITQPSTESKPIVRNNMFDISASRISSNTREGDVPSSVLDTFMSLIAGNDNPVAPQVSWQEQMGLTNPEIVAEIGAGIGSDLQRFSLGESPSFAGIFQDSKGEVNERQQGFIVDQTNKTQRPTTNQQIIDKLLIDPNARADYAKRSGINPEFINRWANMKFEENRQVFGDEYIKNLMRSSGFGYSEEDIKNANLEQVDFKSMNDYARDLDKMKQVNNSQKQMQLQREFFQWQQERISEQKASLLDVRAAGMDEIPEDPADQAIFFQKQEEEYNKQVEEDLNLKRQIDEAKATRPEIEKEQKLQAERIRDFNAGANIEMAMTGKAPSFANQPEISSIEFSDYEKSFQQVALKNLADIGRTESVLGYDRNIVDQDAKSGLVDETKPGYVQEAWGRRPTQAQIAQDFLIANPEMIPAEQRTVDVLKGVNLKTQQAENTAKQQDLMQQRNNTEIETPDFLEALNGKPTGDDSGLALMRMREEEQLKQSRYYAGAGMDFGLGIRKNRIKTPMDTSPLNIKDIEIDEGDNDLGVPDSIIFPTDNMQTQIGNTISPNLENGLMIGQNSFASANIPETETIKNGNDTIITSSGQIISGSSANEILKNKQEVGIKDNVQEYIDQKISENNEIVSGNIIKQTNNIASNVSVATINSALEGM